MPRNTATTKLSAVAIQLVRLLVVFSHCYILLLYVCSKYFTWKLSAGSEVQNCNAIYGHAHTVITELQNYANLHIARNFQFLLMVCVVCTLRRQNSDILSGIFKPDVYLLLLSSRLISTITKNNALVSTNCTENTRISRGKMPSTWLSTSLREAVTWISNSKRNFLTNWWVRLKCIFR